MKFTIITPESAQEIETRENVIAGHLMKIKRTCVINDRLVKAVSFFCEEVEPTREKVRKIFNKLGENPSYYKLSIKDFIIKK